LARIKFFPLSLEGWFFSLDFFLVVCDIDYQLSLLLSILIFFDEVNSALSFQTILFSRFSFLPLVGGSVNRFSSGALLMYQLSPGLSSVLRKYFQLFFEAIHRQGFG